MTRLLKLDRAAAERITDYRKIAGFRNVLIHGYDAVDDATSWSIITQKMTILSSELHTLLPEVREPNEQQNSAEAP